ncbi:MAG: acyltransferase [Candidatus Ochrobactrum gambitense]|nr:MAG: acyltransferase [Candidatus Ochrobactrum gambitense]WEK17229.1 MAG: acyltransferase [Candidatus Ochrobactrum gambitense]
MKRLDFLDAARGLAVIYVVIFHAIFVPYPNLAYPAWMDSFIRFGGSGVLLFFVISGFSLCLTMPKHLNSTAPMLSYAVARLFRIAPLFYVLLVLTLFRDYYFRGIDRSLSEVIASIFFVFNFNPEWSKGIVWASWTIGVEMPFYALFPVLYFWANSTTKKIVLALAFAIATYFFKINVVNSLPQELQGNYSSMNFIKNMPVFIIGMIAFDYFQKSHSENKQTGYIIIVLSLLLLALLATNPAFGYPYVDGKQLQGVAYASLLIGMSISPVKLLVNRVTTYYSKICYSAYLWHPFLIFMLTPVYKLVVASMGQNLALVTNVAITLAVVTVVSQLSFKYIEIPGQKIGKRFLPRMASQRAVTTA